MNQYCTIATRKNTRPIGHWTQKTESQVNTCRRNKLEINLHCLLFDSFCFLLEIFPRQRINVYRYLRWMTIHNHFPNLFMTLTLANPLILFLGAVNILYPLITLPYDRWWAFPDLRSGQKPLWNWYLIPAVNFSEVRKVQLAKSTLLTSTLVSLGSFQIF